MTHIIVFNITLLSVAVYAFVAGGAPERLTAIVFLGAAAASFVALSSHDLGFDRNVVLIDFIALVLLVFIALCANRYWPMYESSLQLLTLAVHGVKIYNPALADWMWAGASSKLAYPTLIVLAIGVLRHRQRQAFFGKDRAWSAFRAAPTV